MHPVGTRDGFRRRRLNLLSAALRAIGLRHDRDDLVTRRDEGLQRWDRKFRRAEKHDPHHWPAFRSFWIAEWYLSSCNMPNGFPKAM